MKTIIAPSAAGKTHWVRTHKWCQDIDLDPLVSALYQRANKYWGNEWWIGPSAPQHIETKDIWFEELAGKLARKTGWYTTAELVLATPQSIFVIPDPDVLVRQAAQRRLAGERNHPVYTFSQAAGNHRKYVAAAERLKALVFTSFDDMKCQVL
jgi:hypothetical protein